MVHKPKHKVHSFRGLLGDPGQEEINLERQNLNLAYRVIRFEIITYQPFSANGEHVMQIFKEEQASASGTVDFDDTNLLGCAIWRHNEAEQYPLSTQSIIFDTNLFSRNIWVTHIDINAAVSCNYYIELEEVPVGAATLMQLKLGVARKLNLQQ
ncbi:unnamed protein product [marine sediment metagenome]|uniref:Uncharacterized protein n=1 Tax=marine sediment metagenome TaxID=412755 RepID=X1L1X8_9ZZZZ